MSSNPYASLVLVLVIGCAGFRRGEYWEGDTEAAPSDAGGDDASTSGPAPSDTGEPQSTSASATTGDVPDTGGESSSGTPSGPAFDDVLPLLRAGCERCHTADGAASTTAFLLDVDDDTAYDITIEFVDLASPGSSRLLAKTAGQGHTGGVIYDDRSAEYDTILAWIEHGAPR